MPQRFDTLVEAAARSHLREVAGWEPDIEVNITHLRTTLYMRKYALVLREPTQRQSDGGNLLSWLRQ